MIGSSGFPISLTNEVWIGAHAVVLPGVMIGDGAIVTTGVVVSRDVPSYAVVAGVPARVIRPIEPPIKRGGEAIDSDSVLQTQ